MTLMRVFISILMAVAFLPFAVGQVVAKAEPDKVIGYKVRMVGLPAEEQALINKIYPVSEDGFIELGGIGKVQTKGKSHAVLAKEIADAYVKAGIYKDPVVVVVEGAEEIDESWIVCDSSSAWITAEEQAKAENRSWTNVTLASFVKAHFGAKTYDDLGEVKLMRNGQVYIYNLMVDRYKNAAIYPNDLLQVLRKSHGPWNEVELSVTGVPTAEGLRIAGCYQVAEDGTIKMWKIGKVDTKGKTADQLAVVLRDGYVKAKIFENPVFVVSGRSLVEGQVNRNFLIVSPGVVKSGDRKTVWTEGLTLGHAVGSVGWTTKRGYSEWVRLHRNGKIYTYSLMIKKHWNIKTFPGDRIEVMGPESKKPAK